MPIDLFSKHRVQKFGITDRQNEKIVLLPVSAAWQRHNKKLSERWDSSRCDKISDTWITLTVGLTIPISLSYHYRVIWRWKYRDLKIWVRCPKVIGDVTILWSSCEFLFVFRCNYGPILYRFRNKATYWSKIAILSCPLLHNTYPAPGEMEANIFPLFLLQLSQISFSGLRCDV